MYREGPQGTPFHTLLVEGYVDGPVDECSFCFAFLYRACNNCRSSAVLMFLQVYVFRGSRRCIRSGKNLLAHTNTFKLTRLQLTCI